MKMRSEEEKMTLRQGLYNYLHASIISFCKSSENKGCGQSSPSCGCSASSSSLQSPQIRWASGLAHAFMPHAGQANLVLLAAFFLRVAASPSPGKRLGWPATAGNHGLAGRKKSGHGAKTRWEARTGDLTAWAGGNIGRERIDALRAVCGAGRAIPAKSGAWRSPHR